MNRRGKRILLYFLRGKKGAAAVELAIILMVFVMILGGIIDFGHAWFMKQVATNASREGARYGITYTTNTSGTRIAPNAYSPTIQTVVTNYLNNVVPPDANPVITPGGTGYTSGAKGAPLQVTVSITKKWFLLNNFGLGSGLTLTAVTTMNCE